MTSTTTDETHGAGAIARPGDGDAPTAGAGPARTLRRTSSWWDAPARLSLAAHVGATIATLVVVGVVNTVLQRMYDATGYPVTFAEGQTTFSAATVREHLGVLESLGTLDDFTRTQLTDFGFLVAYGLSGLVLGALLVRLLPGRWRLLGRVTAGGLVLGAAFDALENLVSFGMIADPAGFPGVLALLHSSFAVAKFATMGAGMLAATIGVVACVVVLVRRRAAR
ncbi:hypothetical protein ACPYO6_07840 [Georgenia sp. Z1344]|uniref:hypothetical protein n=1 Tax=Georgenia sp. Z1344 TaxID=3416706 RepID=UPI003CEFE0FE